MDLLVEFLDFFLEFMFWYFVANCVIDLILWQLHRSNNKVREENEKLIEQLNKCVHAVSEETHGDQKYWFDKDDDTFLAQGKDYKEIIEHLKTRFPDHLFLLNQEHMLVGPDFKLVPIKGNLEMLSKFKNGIISG